MDWQRNWVKVMMDQRFLLTLDSYTRNCTGCNIGFNKCIVMLTCKINIIALTIVKVSCNRNSWV